MKRQNSKPTKPRPPVEPVKLVRDVSVAERPPKSRRPSVNASMTIDPRASQQIRPKPAHPNVPAAVIDAKTLGLGKKKVAAEDSGKLAGPPPAPSKDLAAKPKTPGLDVLHEAKLPVPRKIVPPGKSDGKPADSLMMQSQNPLQKLQVPSKQLSRPPGMKYQLNIPMTPSIVSEAPSSRPSTAPMIVDPRQTVTVVKVPRPHSAPVISHIVEPKKEFEPKKVQLVYKDPRTKLAKPSKSPKRSPSPKPKKLTKSELSTLAQRFKDIDEQRKIIEAHEKGEKMDLEKGRQDMVKLTHKFGIPRQNRIMNAMLDLDYGECDFEGYMRLYYSPAVGNYCLQNWKDRYRGTGLRSKWTTGLELPGIGTKPEELASQLKTKYEYKVKHLELLRDVAKDDIHFEFLKELAMNQVITIPIPIVQIMLRECVPMMEELYLYYYRFSGPDHLYTTLAARNYSRIKNRVKMYDHM